MTLNQLIKKLEKLRELHGKTVKVCADAVALQKSCNDTWNIVDVTEVEFDVVNLVDGDGFTERRKNGQERTFRCIVLK